MDKKHIQGKTEEVKGRIKEGAGALTANRELKQEGQEDQLRGKAKGVFGTAREHAKDLADKVKKKLDDLDRDS